MYYGNNKLQAARKRISQQLQDLGWTLHECPYPANGKIVLNGKYNSPHIFDSFFWYENSLKRFNTGEAYWYSETIGLDLAHLAWRCNADNPHNRHPLDTIDAFEIAHDMMLNGIDFDYEDAQCNTVNETIKIIDWEHPERNSFDFVQAWRGAMNDRFGWDFVLCVNAIPVGAILLEPDQEDAPCQSALDLAHYQLDHDFQFPVYCHSLIISNGKQLLDGDPWMELDEFAPLQSLEEALDPIHFLINRIKSLEE